MSVLLRSDRWSHCLLLLAVVVLAGCGAREATGAKDPAEDQPEAIAVRTQPAQQRTISHTVEALGTCEPLPDKTASLAAAIEGQTAAIPAKVGDAVKAGQVLVQLDRRLAEANLAEKKAARDGLVASLALLKALPRPEEQKGFQLAVDEAKVGVDKAAATVQRLQPLFQRGEIPQQQMFDAKSALEQAKVQLAKAESQQRVAMMGPRPEAIQEAKDHITAADMAVATAQEQLNLLSIRAPIDGVLDKLTCRLGQTLTVGTPFGEIFDIRQLYALVWLAPRDARQVRVSQASHIRAAGQEDQKPSREPGSGSSKPPSSVEAGSGPRAISGKVQFVGRSVDSQTGNFPVRVLFDNAQQQLGVGQAVRVEIVVDQKNTLAVPAEAVFDLEEGPALAVVRQGKAVVLHPRLGVRDREWIEVEGTDLKAGEPVIVEGSWGLASGTAVKERESKETSTGKELEAARTSAAAKPAEGKP